MSTLRPVLGFSSYIFRWAVGTPSFRPTNPLDAFAVLEKAKSLGAESVQFSDNLPIDGMSAGDRTRLIQKARDLEMRIGVGTTGLDSSRLVRNLEVGAEVGASYVRLVLDCRDRRVAEDKLRDVLPTCRALNVGLSLENHSDLSSSDMASVVASIGDPLVRVCLDTANSIGLLELPANFIPTLAPYAVQLHLKDYTVEPMEIGHHVTGRPLGEGMLDLEMVRQSVSAIGYLPEVLLELWTDPLGTEAETLAKEEAWIRASVQKAREWLTTLQPRIGRSHTRSLLDDYQSPRFGS